MNHARRSVGGTWAGGEAAGVYCTKDLAGEMVGDGLVLLSIVFVGYAFEFCVRVMSWEKSGFVFVPLLLILAGLHIGLWVWGWWSWNESFPAMDYTWTFTSEDERNAVLEPVWGAPTPAPTPVGTYGGYGCQQELLRDFAVMQGLVGGVGFGWFCLLYKLMTHTPKVVDAEEMKQKALEAQEGGPKVDLGFEGSNELEVVEEGRAGMVEEEKVKEEELLEKEVEKEGKEEGEDNDEELGELEELEGRGADRGRRTSNVSWSVEENK